MLTSNAYYIGILNQIINIIDDPNEKYVKIKIKKFQKKIILLQQLFVSIPNKNYSFSCWIKYDL